MALKYIVVKFMPDGISGYPSLPITFPDFLKHSDMANRFGGKDNILSAGFCSFAEISCNPRKGQPGVTTEEDLAGTIHTHRWVCWGEATSLQLQSRKETDEALLDSFYR